MRKHKQTYMIIFYMFVFSFTQAQDNYFLKKVLQKYQKSDSIYFRESVFLHLSKNKFKAGEKILYSAFVSDFEGKPILKNRNLYVDLIRPDGSVLYSKLHYTDSLGLSSGSMKIDSGITGGTYFLRAYTASQKNFDHRYMFNTVLFIESEKAEFYTPEYLQKLKKIARKRHRLSLEYAVNGGFLLPDTENVIFVRLTDYLTFPARGKIVITDKISKKKYTTTTDENGNARLNVFFSKNSNLKIKATANKKRISEKIELPVSQGVKIEKVVLTNNKINVEILNKRPATKDIAARSFVLLLRVPGATIASKEIYIGNKVKQNVTLEIPDYKGLTELLLTDYSGELVSKEYIFLQSDKPKPQIRYSFGEDSVYLDIQTDKALRMSAFIYKDNENLDSTNLLTDYFHYKNRTNAKLSPFLNRQHLEWVAAHPNSLTNNKLQNKNNDYFKPEQNIELRGKLIHSVLDLPVPENDIELYVLNNHYDFFKTRTDKKGLFAFKNLHYETDTLKLQFISKNDLGKRAYIIELEDIKKPDFTICYEKDINKRIGLTRSGVAYYKKNTTYVNKKDSVANLSEKLHKNASQVILFKDINTAGYYSTLRVIENYVHGISRNGVSKLRGYTSLVSSSEPLYIIDNIPADKWAVDNLPPENVDRVEILKGGSETSIYGLRGSNGVVAVYTKQGHTHTPGELFLNISGYTKAQKHEYSKSDNLLYFFPTLSTSKKGNFRIAFPHHSNDKLFIDIQGFTSDGEAFVIRKKLIR